MFALTVVQPWASLIVAGHKNIENRTWPASRSMIGKRVVIHAGKKRDSEGYSVAKEIAWRLGLRMELPDNLPYGAAIGTVIIADVVTNYPSPWFFGPFGMLLRDAETWSVPVPYKGALGFWNFPNDLIPKTVR